MHNILSIETGFGKFSLKIQNYFYQEPEDFKQAEKLVPKVEELMQKAKLSYKNLDAVACNIGAGSFTGLRVGLSFAKTIAIVTNIPQIQVTSFEAIAHRFLGQDTFVQIPAGRGQNYFQAFNKNFNAIASADIKNIDEIEIPENYKNIETKDISAQDIALVADYKFKNKDFSKGLKPLYIRLPDAKLSTKNLL